MKHVGFPERKSGGRSGRFDSSQDRAGGGHWRESVLTEIVDGKGGSVGCYLLDRKWIIFFCLLLILIRMTDQIFLFNGIMPVRHDFFIFF